ncbi:hypothetical protein [Nonomuraea endophytica]|uniref:Uncharacterized protein YfaP (DUF2135 family) n=1 Tax=Nonomuraea endophytica TaxID=714136 RepID=A0A7W8AB18_9ACTN|nr:hypothetical protein [Nonomuraea endophytica]MBB5081513.1 uncharacterized protein YfaP (DUF2135 family) [Nonomuraea endophytica]
MGQAKELLIEPTSTPNGAQDGASLLAHRLHAVVAGERALVLVVSTTPMPYRASTLT